MLLRYKGKLYKKNPFDSEPEVIDLKYDFINNKENYNKNMEALTTLLDGRLLLLSEGTFDNKPISAIEWKLHELEKKEYRPGHLAARIYNPKVKDKKWTSVRYAVEENLRPSGATTLPNGDVVVLEVYWCGSNDSSHGHSNNDHKIQNLLKNNQER